MVRSLIMYILSNRSNTGPVAQLNPYDARVLAVVDHPISGKEENGYWVVSSPNGEWVPELRPGVRSVYQRADGRFGFEDWSLWPQHYATRFEYICCIPRQPEDPDDPLSMLWWNPGAIDFVAVVGSSVNLPLGELALDPREKLQVWRDQLVAEIKEYHATHDHNTLLGLLETSMRHAWYRLTLAPMTRQQMTENVPEFQRYCLDIRALLDYILIYSPRQTLPDSETNDLPVAHHLMGAVTESDETVMQLFKMKIPVWHIRPSLRISANVNIQEVVYFSSPRDMTLLVYAGNPFRVICKLPPGTERLQATQRLGCVVLSLFSDISSVEEGANNLSGPQRGGGSQRPVRPAPCTSWFEIPLLVLTMLFL